MSSRGESAEAEENGDKRAPAEEYKAFVGGISWHLEDKDLREMFRKYGAVDARIMLDRQTGRSRGFGFVHFDTQEDLQAAIDSMHDTEADGRKISVTRAVPQNETAPGVPARVLSSRDRGYARDSRDTRYERYPRGGFYERGYDRRDRGNDRGPYDRGYDRGPYDRSYYDRGYPPYGGYDRGYGRDPRDVYYERYPDPEYDRYSDYDRGGDPWVDRYPPDHRGGGYGRSPPDRGMPPSYDRQPAYSRAGPERERYAPSSRTAPYERTR